MPGLDPRIAPFVTKQTDIIIAIDVTRIDLDSVAADMLNELGQSQMDQPSAARIRATIQMGLVAGRQLIAGFKQAGGSSLYFLSRADQLSSGGGTGSMSLTGSMALYPADSPAAAQTLAKFMTGPRSVPLKVIGNVVVDEKSASPFEGFSPIADSRPALAAGLSSGGDSPVRIAINPVKLREIVPKFLAAGNLAGKFTDDEWDDVESFSMSLALPPTQSPGFVIVSHYKDAATAEKGYTGAMHRLHDEVTTLPDANTQLAKSMLKVISTEKVTIKDSDLVGVIDLHAYYDLIFTAVLNASHQPASSPPQPTN